MGNRVPFEWINFKESNGGTGKYAEGWFFLVHPSFKAALDIVHSVLTYKSETRALRNAKSIEFTGPYKGWGNSTRGYS